MENGCNSNGHGRGSRHQLWCVPRTTSTSFLKCMTHVPNSQVWYEPFGHWDLYSSHGKKRDAMIGILREYWEPDEADEKKNDFAADVKGNKPNF